MNEGQVRVGSRTFEIGRLRSWVSLVAGLALGAGLAIGVVSAAPHGSSPELTGLPATPRAPQAGDAPRAPIRRPLHQLLLQRAAGQAQRTNSQGRFVAGRITEIDGNTVTVALPTAVAGPSAGATDAAAIQTRVVRILPQTRAPAQRPRTGDFLLAVGRPEADGSLSARAVAVRRPGQLLRRQAAPTTTVAPGRA